jgi:hypothetical protein
MTLRHREEPAKEQADLAVDCLGPVHQEVDPRRPAWEAVPHWRAARPTNESDLAVVGIIADIELRGTRMKQIGHAERRRAL